MRHIVTLLSGLLVAAGASGVENPQPDRRQERMEVCTAQAEDAQLKGRDLRDYMHECLKGGSPAQIAGQQQKILSCEEENANQPLTLRERNKLLGECLRG